MPQYIRLGTFPLSEILPLIPSEEKIELLGEKVNCRSKRLQQFKVSTSCKKCGLEGQFFALERQKGSKMPNYHLNLYGTNRDGRETMLTQDHVHPLSLGGKDTLENSQTLCLPCNSLKADKLKF